MVFVFLFFFFVNMKLHFFIFLDNVAIDVNGKLTFLMVKVLSMYMEIKVKTSCFVYISFFTTSAKA